MSSIFQVEVVRLGPIEKHPDADTLGIVHVYGYQIIVKLDDWHEGDLAAYIPPDSVVPDTEQYAFLAGHRRITVRRFRGLYSMGLLVTAPNGAVEGEDVAEQLGITHYEPPIKEFNPHYGPSEADKAPEGYRPHYDVEHYLRYGARFLPGELVVATEKIHGANARFTYQDGRFHVGSHNQWKRLNPNIWWRVLLIQPMVGDFLKHFEGYTLYGEVYGCVQDLRYGHKDGAVSVRFFDLLNDSGLWEEHDTARALTNFPSGLWVPELYRGLLDDSVLKALAEGQSTLPGADNIREGIVIKSIPERSDPYIGRMQMKLVSSKYLEKSNR